MIAISAISGLRTPLVSPPRGQIQQTILSELIEMVNLYGQSVRKDVEDNMNGFSVNTLSAATFNN